MWTTKCDVARATRARRDHDDDDDDDVTTTTTTTRDRSVGRSVDR